MSLGSEIRKARELRGWSQAELARRADIGRSTLTEIESGKHEPNLNTAGEIYFAFNNIDECYKNGYDAGFDDGSDAGFKQGREEGLREKLDVELQDKNPTAVDAMYFLRGIEKGRASCQCFFCRATRWVWRGK